MNTIDWTRDELVAYILLFAANSDFKEDPKEKEMILSLVDKKTFQEIHDEFDSDNDYRSIKKITISLEQHNYSNDDVDALLEDIEVLFYADDDFSINEKIMLKFLQRLLKS